MSDVEPVRVGLVGAGPWAELFHGPMLAGSPRTDLVGIWARRPEAAASLAARLGTEAVGSYAALLERCEAVAFSVPPDVQSAMGIEAARAGKHLLLEKPTGMNVAQALALAEAADAAGVRTVLVLTRRYMPAVRSFVAEAAPLTVTGAVLTWVAGGALDGSTFATPWRRSEGALLDLGAHAFDILEATVGPIASVRASGDPTRFVAVTANHAGGAVSQLSLSLMTPVPGGDLELALYGPHGVLRGPELADPAVFEPQVAAAVTNVVTEFADTVRSGVAHPLDVHRGLALQRLIDEAAASLG